MTDTLPESTPTENVEQVPQPEQTPSVPEQVPVTSEQRRAQLGKLRAEMDEIAHQTQASKEAEEQVEALRQQAEDLAKKEEEAQQVEATASSSAPQEKKSIWTDIQMLIEQIMNIFSGEKKEEDKNKKDEQKKQADSKEWTNQKYEAQDPDAPVFSFPKGTSSRLTSVMGHREAPKTKQGHGSTDHKGFDIGVPEGTPILLTASSARVDAIKTQPDGAGHYVVLELEDGSKVYFMHLREEPDFLKEGQELTRGALLAFSGDSGNSSGPHLHYEVRKNGTAVNPEAYLVEAYHAEHEDQQRVA